MSYVKAQCVLPREILELVQEYAEGQYLYIPKKDENRKSWGTNTNFKHEVKLRNRAIYTRYISGCSTSELAEEFYLSTKSIQRIVLQEKKSHSNYDR